MSASVSEPKVGVPAPQEVRAAARRRMEARLFLVDWWESGQHADLEWRLGAGAVTRLTEAVLAGRSTTGWIVRRALRDTTTGQVLALVRVKPSQVATHVHAYLYEECQVPSNGCLVRWTEDEGLDAVFAAGAGDAFEAACVAASSRVEVERLT